VIRRLARLVQQAIRSKRQGDLADLHRVGDLRPVPADRGPYRPIVIDSSIDGVLSRRQIGAVRDGSHRLGTAY
jgi:hypothetical protein